MLWIKTLTNLLRGDRIHDEMDLPGEVHLMKESLRVTYRGVPIQIILGRQRQGKTLWICPEFLLDPELMEEMPDFIIFDPQHFFTETCGFLRLERGEHVVLGRGDREQQAFFHFSRDVALKHVRITHDGDGILLEDLTKRSGTYITPLGEALEEERHVSQRVSRLARLRAIYGSSLRPLDPHTAQNTLAQLNDILTDEAMRPRAKQDVCGSLLELDDDLTPLIIGDLHGQVDNLLKILSENNFLGGLEKGRVALIILGDAVHSEHDGELDQMDESVLMMDLIFKLKLRFPKQVHYLIGNHDSFSEHVIKGGIPQGLLWKQKLAELRGHTYVDMMSRFYRRSPYCVVSKYFIGCHAGPIKGKVTREQIIQLHDYPRQMKELIWNRLRRPNHPVGYTRHDVARFRRGLKLAPETPFIVAHNPLSREETIWENVDGIENHHIVFSGLRDQVGLFFQIKGQMVPLIYKAEPLLGLVNRL